MIKFAGIVTFAVASCASLLMITSASSGCTAGVVAPVDEGGTKSASGNGNGNGNGNGTGNGNGNGNGSGFDTDSGSGGGLSGCTPPAGSYKVHYTKESGDSSCIGPADSNVTVSDQDAGSGFNPGTCTTTNNAATCTTTSHCSSMSNGSTITIDTTVTFSGTSGSGTFHEVVTGTNPLDCTFAITYTKN